MDNLGPLQNINFVRAEGCRLWTSSGYDFIDFTCAWGTISLGYCDPGVDRAAQEAIHSGVQFPVHDRLFEDVRARLAELFGTEQALAFKTGTEACMAAIRVARAATKRMLVARCGYHGWADWCNRGIGTVPPNERNRVTCVQPGILPSTAAYTIDILDPNELGVVEGIFETHGEQISCLILDPTEFAQLPDPRLRELRELCSQWGVLLILDELKSAFRVSAHGAQGLSNVRADLTVIGKGVANGFPIAFVLGPRRLLDEPYAFTAGTFSNDRVALAATLATLNAFIKCDPCSQMAMRGEHLIAELQRILEIKSLSSIVRARAWSHATMPFLDFLDTDNSVKARFFECLSAERIAWYRNHMCFISAAHDSDTLEEALARFSVACERFTQEI